MYGFPDAPDLELPRWLLRGRSGNGYSQARLRPVRRQRPAMRERNLLADGEPEASAVVAPMGTAPEASEDLRQLLPTHAGSPIAYQQCRGADPYLHVCASGRMLNGVFQQILEQRNSLAAGLPSWLESSRSAWRAGAWLTDRWTLTPRLRAEPGLRVDWSGLSGEVVASPRMALVADVTSKIRLRLAGG